MNFSSIIGFFIISILFSTLGSCMRITNTQKNLEKIATELPETHSIENPILIKAENPNEKKQEKDTDKPIPLAVFLSPDQKTVIRYPNAWFPKLVEWSKVYRNIAVDEQNVRSFSLSEKYSKIALLWADRAIEIKNMTATQAIRIVKPWLDGLQFGVLPSQPNYFIGQEAYEKATETKLILESHKQRPCLILKGYQIVQAAAYLEITADLLRTKLYSKALVMAQNSWSLVSQMDDEKSVCN